MKQAPKGNTPAKSMRLTAVDIRRLAYLKKRLGLQSDTEVIRYALKTATELAGGS